MLDSIRVCEVQITEGRMQEEVPHPLDTEPTEGLLACTRYIFETADVLSENEGLRQARRGARCGQSASHRSPNLLDGEDHRIERLLATVRVDLELGLSLLDGVDDVLEGLVVELLAGEDR